MSNSSKFLSLNLLFTHFLWIMNDRLLKPEFHNKITGKLDDILGLSVFLFLNCISFIACYGLSERVESLFCTNLGVTILFPLLIRVRTGTIGFMPIFGNQNGTADKTRFTLRSCLSFGEFLFYIKIFGRKF